MKLSIVIPVYYNEDNLIPLYEDIKKKIIEVIDYDYEIVMVNDGSQDNSYQVMKQLAEKDENIKIVSLSRNFGSHAAILCGLSKCTGDCAVIKAADLQSLRNLFWKWQKAGKRDIMWYLPFVRGVKKVKDRLCLLICIIGWSERHHCRLCQRVDLTHISLIGR